MFNTVNTKVLNALELVKQLERLQAAREGRRLTLDDLARLTGYAKSTLSNVERGRFRPSAELIEAVRAALEINREWLETGSGPVYDPSCQGGKWAKEDIRARLDIIGRQIDRLDWEIRSLQGQRDVTLQAQRSLFRLLDTFEGKPLTSVHNYGQSTEMQQLLPALRERIKRATKGHGRQAQLARDLRVNRQSVSAWLGETEPGGEMTLQLLRWVEQQEAQQQKAPARGKHSRGKEAQSSTE